MGYNYKFTGKSGAMFARKVNASYENIIVTVHDDADLNFIDIFVCAESFVDLKVTAFDAS